MKRLTSISRLAGSMIIALVIMASFPLACKPSQKYTGPREKIIIAYSTAVNAVLVYIAFAKGYFAEEGLDATPQPHAFGKLALNAVIEGKADIATAADTPIIYAVMNGKKITALAAIQTSNRDNAIVARKDRGITKPAELRGKSIGVPLGTNAEFFLGAFLLAHDIQRGHVTLIDMKPDAMANALTQGAVDAVSTFNPTIKQLERQLGKHGMVFYGEMLYTETFCIAAMQEYAKRNPEATKKVLRALIKAETFVQQHDREARVLVADFIKLDKAVVDELWGIFTFRVALDQALLVNFEDQTRWALKNSVAPGKTMPNYLDYLYADGLYSVKPEAVRIIR